MLNVLPTVLMMHVLAFGTMLFAIGSGGPKRHEHSWLPPFVVLQWAPTFPAVHMSQSWSFPQAKSQSEPAVQLRPTRPRVQVPAVQIPDPVQVKMLVSQVPAAAAAQVPTGLVQLRMLPVWAAVNGPAVSVVPLQVVPMNETPLSGTTDGSGTVSPEPPKNRPLFVRGMLPVPTWY